MPVYLIKKFFDSHGQLGFRTFCKFTISETVKVITEKSYCKNIVGKIVNNKLSSGVGFDLQRINQYNMVYYTIYGVILKRKAPVITKKL